MKEAKAIQICGTGSGVGKSVISCALCRIFFEDGYSVAPFKSQNMALNSFVTEDGKEIGRAQAMQALACKIKPVADINPILIKPASNTTAQIILQGKPVRNMSVYEYKNYKRLVFGKVKESLKRLKNRYEIIVIEGAGSPAEINLKKHDLVNIKIAALAKAAVILVGDIDRGGVFAWLIGTLQLLTEKERRMVKGIIINKFRGDKRLLIPGINFLEKYTGIKVLGVIPYFQDMEIPEEDSLALKPQKKSFDLKRKIKIDVIYLPHISNFTDFDALEQEDDVSLRYIRKDGQLCNADVIIIPGTKNTTEDLSCLKKSGLAEKIISIFHSRPAVTIIGICGGYQMLGERIYDRKGIESKRIEIRGLGILPIVTEFYSEKVLSQVKGRYLFSDIEVAGYEIHHGKTKITGNSKPLFEIFQSGNKKTQRFDGTMAQDTRCWGTYIHGVFDNDKFRRYFLNSIRRKKGWEALKRGKDYDMEKGIASLARLVRENIDLDLLYKILNGRDR